MKNKSSGITQLNWKVHKFSSLTELLNSIIQNHDSLKGPDTYSVPLSSARTGYRDLHVGLWLCIWQKETLDHLVSWNLGPKVNTKEPPDPLLASQILGAFEMCGHKWNSRDTKTSPVVSRIQFWKLLATLNNRQPRSNKTKSWKSQNVLVLQCSIIIIGTQVF